MSTVLADAKKAVMNLSMEDRIKLAHDAFGRLGGRTDQSGRN